MSYIITLASGERIQVFARTDAFDALEFVRNEGLRPVDIEEAPCLSSALH